MSRGSRRRRQERRAAKLNKPLVAVEDLQTIKGMSIGDLVNYAQDKHLRVRFRRVDGEKVEDDQQSGPDALVVEIRDGYVSSAKTTRKLEKEDLPRCVKCGHYIGGSLLFECKVCGSKYCYRHKRLEEVLKTACQVCTKAIVPVTVGKKALY